MNFDDIMKQMKQKYLTDIKDQIDHLKKLSEEKDLKALESFFHKLKGSGASYGVPEISSYGAKYELKAKENSLSDEELSSLVSELEEIHKNAA